MSIPLIVYLLAVISAAAATLLSVPFWRWWCVRSGLVDEPGHRKIHEQPIALAGGLAVMTGLVIPTLIGCLILWWRGTQGSPLDDKTAFLLHHGLNRRGLELAVIFAGAFGMVVVGWLDDKHELRPRAKFAGQVLIALCVAAAGVRITLFVPNILFSYAITVLWIVTLINAFNFMDNMNGLCAGLGAIGAWYFATIAAAHDQYLVALIAFLTFGALAAFLRYNFPHARVFLGDAGSHLVGYLLAVLAILPHYYSSKHPRRLAVLIPLLVLAVPLLDLVWVVILRWRIGQPFYQGDTNHLSHRLVRTGLSRTQAVLLIWLAAAAIGAVVYLC
jgi:UDP-GlcNAc:undecaprenyl-phosphate GlcNAc-1-phosphate transferase